MSTLEHQLAEAVHGIAADLIDREYGSARDNDAFAEVIVDEIAVPYVFLGSFYRDWFVKKVKEELMPLIEDYTQERIDEIMAEMNYDEEND